MTPCKACFYQFYFQHPTRKAFQATAFHTYVPHFITTFEYFVSLSQQLCVSTLSFLKLTWSARVRRTHLNSVKLSFCLLFSLSPQVFLSYVTLASTTVSNSLFLTSKPRFLTLNILFYAPKVSSPNLSLSLTSFCVVNLQPLWNNIPKITKELTSSYASSQLPPVAQ